MLNVSDCICIPLDSGSVMAAAARMGLGVFGSAPLQEGQLLQHSSKFLVSPAQVLRSRICHGVLAGKGSMMAAATRMGESAPLQEGQLLQHSSKILASSMC